MTDVWQIWRDHLVEELSTLREGEFINTWAPTVTRDGGTGWVGRRRPPEVVSAPVVRFLHAEDLLLVESVPAFPTRGEPELSDEQRVRLHAAGWRLPGDQDYVSVGGPDLRTYLPFAQVGAAADLAVETYRVLGVEDPGPIGEERDR